MNEFTSKCADACPFGHVQTRCDNKCNSLTNDTASKLANNIYLCSELRPTEVVYKESDVREALAELQAKLEKAQNSDQHNFDRWQEAVIDKKELRAIAWQSLEVLKKTRGLLVKLDAEMVPLPGIYPYFHADVTKTINDLIDTLRQDTLKEEY